MITELISGFVPEGLPWAEIKSNKSLVLNNMEWIFSQYVTYIDGGFDGFCSSLPHRNTN